MRWRLYLINEEKEKHRHEWYDYHRQDYYLAKIAYEIYILRHELENMGKDHMPEPKLTFKQFFLDLKKKKLSIEEELEKERQKEEFEENKLHLSKARWFAALPGLKP